MDEDTASETVQCFRSMNSDDLISVDDECGEWEGRTDTFVVGVYHHLSASPGIIGDNVGRRASRASRKRRSQHVMRHS